MAWDWIEIGRGVIAMVDPMCVLTNMRLLGNDGDVLGANQAALYLNQFVRNLPWQDEVMRMIHAS